jgi:Kef-type K+ transport system membrane component KefB
MLKILSCKSLIIFFVLAFFFLFSYRLSEIYCPGSESGCFMAIIVTVISSLAVFIPFCMNYDKKTSIFLSAIMIGVLMRVLITLVGVVAVSYFAKEERVWFLRWLCGFYLISLVLETSLVVYFFKKHLFRKEGSSEDDDSSAFSCKYESS